LFSWANLELILYIKGYAAWSVIYF